MNDSLALLVAVDGDLQAMRWSAAIQKTRRVFTSPADPPPSAEIIQQLQAKLAQAEREAAAEQVYKRFVASASNGRYEQAFADYAKLTESAIYHQLARATHEQALSSFIEGHLRAAEAARQQNGCNDFRSHISAILTYAPKDARALADKERPCGNLPVVTLIPISRAATEGDSLAKAQAAYESGNYEQAIKFARSSKAMANDSHRAWFVYGLASCQLKSVDDARAAYQKLAGMERDALISACRARNILALDVMLAPQTDASDAERPSLSAAEADRKLNAAQDEYIKGNYKSAMTMAWAAQRSDPARAWRVIGSAACNTRQISVIDDAYSRLDAQGREYLLYVCRRNGIQMAGKQFKVMND